jgi:outer membrane receptor protein involved in Fe transport
VNRSLAHGAEFTLRGTLTSRVQIESGYTYTSTRILEAPFAFDPLLAAGQSLLRRPKHSGNLLLTYLGSRWGANLGGSFVGRRTDSDFLGFNVNHAAGYARVDLGGWYAVNSRITAYINVENALNDHYNEVVGYPALTANFRAGLRFRIGGE